MSTKIKWTDVTVKLGSRIIEAEAIQFIENKPNVSSWDKFKILQHEINQDLHYMLRTGQANIKGILVHPEFYRYLHKQHGHSQTFEGIELFGLKVYRSLDIGETEFQFTTNCKP